MILVTVMSMASCVGDNPEEPIDSDTDLITSKSTTQAPVQIVDIPTEKTELAEMLNSAIDYVELYCYHYTKHTACDVSSLNIGTLSQASNAADAFKSIFGEKDISIDYEYNTSRTAFAENFPAGGYKAEDMTDISAEQVGESIVITALFPDESNLESEGGLLNTMKADCQNAETVKKSLSEFNSSANAVNVSASNIKMTATISAKDSSLTKLEVSYTERYSLSGVTLVKLEGSSVTGAANTVVSFTDIGV